MNQRRREIEKLRQEIPQDAAFTAEDLAAWQDLPTFLESQYYIPADDTPQRSRSIVLQPHQRAILRLAFRKDAEGRFLYRTILYSTIKKSGKTEIASGVNLWAGLTWDSHLELFACANDFEQSQGRVFSGVARALSMNSRFADLCKVTSNCITFPNHSTLTALASDYAGAAGAQRLALSSWDELWAYTTESANRLYDELTPIPTIKNSLRFIVTYAGFEGESTLLWGLYERTVLKGEKVSPEELEGLDLPVYRNGAMLAYWDSLETAGEACRRMPWQQGAEGDRYYTEQAQELRPNAFRRLHWNLWTSNEENFLDPGQWDACVDAAHRPILPDKSIILDVGVDAAIKHDQASVVAVTREPGGKVVLAQHRTFQPTPESPLDLEETLEAFLLELSRGYTLRSVYYDPYQFHRSAMTLLKQGLPMVEFPQTTSNLTAMGQNLYELVQYGNLRLYLDTDMRKAAGQAVAVETPRGWRISKEKSVHKIDPIIALAHAAFGCVGALDGDYFDARRLAQLRAEALEPVQTLRLEVDPSQYSYRLPKLKAIPDQAGVLRIFDLQQEQCRHDIGAAVVNGVCCAYVLRRNKVVAELYGALPADLFAAQVAYLGRQYPFALIAPLVNAGGQYLLAKLREEQGLYLFGRQVQAGQHHPQTRVDYGFLLNAATVEIFWGELAAWVQSEEGIQAPREFYDEARHFTRQQSKLLVDVNTGCLRVAAMALAVQCARSPYIPGLPHSDPVSMIREVER